MNIKDMTNEQKRALVRKEILKDSTINSHRLSITLGVSFSMVKNVRSNLIEEGYKLKEVVKMLPKQNLPRNGSGGAHPDDVPHMARAAKVRQLWPVRVRA